MLDWQNSKEQVNYSSWIKNSLQCDVNINIEKVRTAKKSLKFEKNYD